MAVSAVGPLQDAIDDSTLLPPNDPLTRLLLSLDKHHLIHIILQWIQDAQNSPSSKLLPPQLSRRAARKSLFRNLTNIDESPSRDDQRACTSSFLDLHENRRARSYKELSRLWLENMSDSKVSKSRAVDRIINVDWPTGLTYAMIATLAFEQVRANRDRRIWHTLRLDYEEEEEAETSKTSENSGKVLFKPNSIKRLLSRTPSQIREAFSAEMQHYCSHAVFLDSHIQATEQAHEADNFEPLPFNWCQPFTHLRVVTNYTPIDVCSTGLHILHIPQSSWCIISGTLGRSGGEVREMALTAFANSLGAKRIKLAHNVQKQDEATVEMGEMTELRGKDPLALRDILLHAGLISESIEGDQDGLTGGLAPDGGKGRSMMRGEAEDGPLTRADKRKREDPSGIYRELEAEQQSWQEQDFDLESKVHPKIARAAHIKKQRVQRARDRECYDVLGEVKNLPRLERLQYELKLPMRLNVGSDIELNEAIKEQPIGLRLEGSHILTGLRNLIQVGLDADHLGDASSKGMPSWLTSIRGTKVTVAVDDHGDAIIESAFPQYSTSML